MVGAIEKVHLDGTTEQSRGFWQRSDLHEFALRGEESTDVAALSREWVRMAQDYGVANVSVTRYP
jgi:hypothetical protein